MLLRSLFYMYTYVVQSQFYFKQSGESNTLFIIKIAIFVDGPVLVQFTSSFTVLLSWLFEVCGRTQRVSQARMAARHYTGRFKPFDNMTFKALVFLCGE